MHCSADRRGFLPGVPGSANATGPQVLIAAWTTVGLLPGVPQVLTSLLQHKPRGSCARRPRFSRCHRSSGPYCSTNPNLVPGGPSPRCQVALWRLGFTLEVPLLAIPSITQKLL